MSKALYTFFNDQDLFDLIAFLNTQGISVFTQNGTPLSEVHAIGGNNVTLCIPNCESCNIKITTCSHQGYFLQPGMILLKNETDPYLRSTFNAIKKFIRQFYKLSKKKSYYFGPGIYQDWLQQKHQFPVLFEYDNYFIPEQDIEKIFSDISESGFVIRANDVRLRSIIEWTIRDESFVICEDVDNLNTLVIRKTFIHYNYGSKCIFVYKDSKRRQYEFMLDKRIDVSAHCKLIELFEDIRKQYGQ